MPKDHRFTFKKILHYFYNYGCDMNMLSDLLELFEENAALGKPVRDIVGSDVAAFCDGLIRANEAVLINTRDKFNQEILKHFQKEGK